MSRPTLGADVCWNIAALSSNATRRTLLQLSSSVYCVVCPLLYRHIEVEHRALKLVDSLANNTRLPKIVHSLVFEDSVATQVDPTQWSVVLPSLCNLRLLVVCRNIPFPSHILPCITFRLKYFGSVSYVVGTWTELIASQPQLCELRLDSDFFGPVPGPLLLPILRSVKGRPSDLARFARHHPLRDLWFFTTGPQRSLNPRDLRLFALSPARLLSIRIGAGQFIMLFRVAPTLLTSLHHIVLDEDSTWSEFAITAALKNCTLEPFAATLNHRFTDLKSVLLIFSTTLAHSRPLLGRADGAAFSRTLSLLCSAPLLHTFRVYAYDGWATWDWGSNPGLITFLGPPPPSKLGYSHRF